MPDLTSPPKPDLEAIWRDSVSALRAGRAGDALAGFQRVLDAGHANAAVWLGVAVARLQLGDRPGERAALMEVLAFDPRDLRALLGLADNYAAADDTRAAYAYYG